jgi:hypothetical protein
LTTLDKYIFSGVATCMFLFLANVFSICPSLEAREAMEPADRAEADDECRKATERNDNLHIAIACWWVAANIFIGRVILGYARNNLVTDKWRFRRAAPSTAVRSMLVSVDGHSLSQRTEKQRRKRKQQLMFYEPAMATLFMRRMAALETFRQMERSEVALIKRIKVLRDGASHRDELKRLMRTRHNNIPEVPILLRQCRRSVERHAMFMLDHTTQLASLFFRAMLNREASTIGPLLHNAFLDTAHMRRIYRDGRGITAVNSLLVQAGVHETHLRVKLIAALGEKTSVAGAPVRYIVLQGAAELLWEGVGLGTLNLSGSHPLPRAVILEKIDLLLFGDGYDRNVQQLKLSTEQSDDKPGDADDDVLRRYLGIVRRNASIQGLASARDSDLLEQAKQLILQHPKLVPQLQDVVEAVEPLGRVAVVPTGGDNVRVLQSTAHSGVGSSVDTTCAVSAHVVIGHASIYPTGIDGPDPKRVVVVLAAYDDRDAGRVKLVKAIVDTLQKSSRATTRQLLAADLAEYGVPFGQDSTLLLNVDGTIVHILFHPHKTRRRLPAADGTHVDEFVALGPTSVFQDRDLTADELWNMSSCILARLILTSRLPGAAVMVHAQSRFKSASTENDLFTQAWTGYLSEQDATAWPSSNYAVVLHIGSVITPLGYAMPRAQEGDELRAFRVGHESPPRSVVQLFDQLIEHIDALSPCKCTAETGAMESATEIMGTLCAELQGSLSFLITEANLDLAKRGCGPLDFESVDVFIYGTRHLRVWRDKMESAHGILASSVLESFPTFLSSLLLHGTDATPTMGSGLQLARDLQVHFEILSADENIDADLRAYTEAVKYGKGVPIELQDAVVSSGTKKHMVGSVAFGADACRGKVAGRYFSADVSRDRCVARRALAHGCTPKGLHSMQFPGDDAYACLERLRGDYCANMYFQLPGVFAGFMYRARGSLTSSSFSRKWLQKKSDTRHPSPIWCGKKRKLGA